MKKIWVLFCVSLFVLMFVLIPLIWTTGSGFDVGPRTVTPLYLYYRIDPENPVYTCPLPISHSYREVFRAIGAMPALVFGEAHIIQFSSLNKIDSQLGQIRFRQDPSRLFIQGLRGSDDMACKARMYMHMRHALPARDVEKVLPKTFILSELLGEQDLPKNDEVFILKKNIQRQQGHLLTRDIRLIWEEAQKKDYVVAQILLQDPLTINGRKVNMRVYMLVVIAPSSAPQFYVYDNGFMYYTPEAFVPNSTDPSVNLTTGYIDRAVYTECPLSFRDLESYIGTTSYGVLFQNILTLFRYVKKTFRPILDRENRGIPGTRFLVYGCDIAPDEKLHVKLMEINKGPDLNYKDERDRAVKFHMLKDMFELVGASSAIRNPNHFVVIS
jgi:hypothetical protein